MEQLEIDFDKQYDVIINNYGDKYWYLNGERHRVNGPAVDLINGDKYWYLNGEQVDPF